MSEDEDASDGEAWRHFELTLRADNVTMFFQELDERSATNKKDYMAERTKRTKSWISTLPPPRNAPAWVFKQSSAENTHETPLARNQGRGRGVRARGLSKIDQVKKFGQS